MELYEESSRRHDPSEVGGSWILASKLTNGAVSEVNSNGVELRPEDLEQIACSNL